MTRQLVVAGLVGVIIGASGVKIWDEFKPKEYSVNVKEDLVTRDVRVQVEYAGPFGYGVKSDTFDFRNTASASVESAAPFVNYFENQLLGDYTGTVVLYEEESLFLFRTDSTLHPNKELETLEELYNIVSP